MSGTHAMRTDQGATHKHPCPNALPACAQAVPNLRTFRYSPSPGRNVGLLIVGLCGMLQVEVERLATRVLEFELRAVFGWLSRCRGGDEAAYLTLPARTKLDSVSQQLN